MDKTEQEIVYLTRAAQLTVKAYNQVVNRLKKGDFQTEKSIELYLQKFAHRHKTKLSFPPIIASGKNTKNPHHKTSNKKLTKGFLMIDFGISHKNYCSDMTRMLYLGKPTEKEMKMYNFLLKIQEQTIKELQLGQKTKEVEEKVRKLLGRYSRYFAHSLGHGVGTKIHELPRFGSKSRNIIKPNRIFTIEPGIYFKNFGLRIEDTILMRDKPIILTKAKKKLISINF
jgi:Xaa-Pro aminopeptidase